MHLRARLFLFSLVSMPGCLGGDPEPRGEPELALCIPGESIRCTCRDGNRGAQECDADGTFGRCECQVPGSSGGSSNGDAGSSGAGSENAAAGQAGAASGSAGSSGTGFGDSPAPRVIPLSGVQNLALGLDHACALSNDRTVRCWGGNALGQLGDGSRASRNFPVEVAGLGNDTIAVAAGLYSTCALSKNGTVRCWGGFGETPDSAVDYGIRPRALPEYAEIATLRGGYRYAAILSTEGVRYWGAWEGKEVTYPYPYVAGVLDAAAGAYHQCALSVLGNVRCAGNNTYLQLGSDAPSSSDQSGFYGVELGSKALELGVGYAHSCALLDDRTVTCWGYNWQGQLGGGADAKKSTPVVVPNVRDVRQLSVNDLNACVLHDSGTITCWGRNVEGQCGNGTASETAAPSQVVGIDDATEVFVGAGFSCAIVASGNVKCWGGNTYGQLGDRTTNNQPKPVLVRE